MGTPWRRSWRAAFLRRTISPTTCLARPGLVLAMAMRSAVIAWRLPVVPSHERLKSNLELFCSTNHVNHVD
jgi:hypothetical protein